MRTMDEYKAFLAAVRTNTGLDMLTPDDEGLVSVRVDGAYTLNLQFVEATGKVLCFVEIAELPKDAPKAVSETVIYNYFFDGDVVANDPEEFVSTLEKILQLCDAWAERISGNLTDDTANTPEADSPMHWDLRV